eukprot:Blabericola_migrator_1__9086@NODE_4847_length_957_cov_43_493258_g3028_i0_p1_GENE_NODE_4847_length_957_cov_43_493258_g3028_i0NODE_4847_length_957_cov_43_493258_g3028_i0_p1_ORF_typecomplete_len139_score22_16_NODE_4847_length_957_cov_43_493258_g3028_i0139555
MHTTESPITPTNPEIAPIAGSVMSPNAVPSPHAPLDDAKRKNADNLDVTEGGIGAEAPDDGSDVIYEGDLHAGYKSSLNNLLTSKAHLNKLIRMKEDALEGNDDAKDYVATYERYVEAVKSRDRRFPEHFTCMGCRRT